MTNVRAAIAVAIATALLGTVALAPARAVAAQAAAGEGDLPPLPRTTAPSIALRNLDYVIARQAHRLDAVPGDPAALASWLDALLTRVQFLGSFDDLVDAERRSTRALEASVDGDSGPSAGAAALRIERARVLAQLHRFDEARAQLDRAAEALVGLPEASTLRLRRALAAERRAIDLATGAASRVLEAAAEEAPRTGPDFESATQLGAALAAVGRREEAEEAYRSALADWDGLTPFAPAWVEFRIGEVWNGEDDVRARRHFERAVEILPAYVTARVHLAELVAAQDGPDAAFALLEPALDSQDPEPAARLAEFAAAAGRDDAEALRARAGAHWSELLERYPLAFADHGAEFYLGAGADPEAALAWARRNLANRATDRARGLVVRAALAAGEDPCVPGIEGDTADPTLADALEARRAAGFDCSG